MDFAAGSWQDTAQNVNLAESESFTVSGPDGLPPTADLADPSPGSSISAGALNGRQYLDVTFADPGGSGLDPGSITDPGAEFTLSGSAAAGVVVDGAAVLVSGSTYRYAFSGSFAEGPVQVDFAAGSWQDTAQNVNLAESESFQVTVPAAEIILDNRDAEVTFGGSWGTASNIPGFHGPDYRHDNKTGKGSKTATFQPALAVAGTYDVYMQWSGSSIYSDNVPVDIVHAGGTSTVLVNQKTNGNQWNLLGNYAFVAGSSGHVTIRTDGTTGYVMADAVRFVRTTDTIAPSADLADPSPGGSISAGTLNGRQYLDVTFADTGGSGLDPGSITDPGAEFTLSGSAAAGVVVDGAAVLVSGSTYRYAFSGSFAEGPVQVDFAAGSWQDTAQNVNLAESESFTVSGPDGLPPTADLADPSPGSSISAGTLNGRQYLDVTFADSGGSGLDPGSITDAGAEFTLSGSAAAGVVVDGAAVLVSGSTYRYAFNGSFAEGPVQVDFAAGSWQDNAQNVNLAESESFNLALQLIEVTDADSLQIALNNAVTGDDIVLASGTYAGRFYAEGLTGVTIRSADLNNRAVINASGFGEGLKLSSVKQVTISDLVIENASANAINIDDGGFIEISEDISLRNLLIRNGTGDGIKLTGVENFHVDQVQVIGWSAFGTAVNMIGSHFGLVERSYFENALPGGGTGVQAKGGSSNIVIRANRLINANERSIQIGGATSLSLFRPQPPGDVEASAIVVEGNFISHNGNVGQGIRAAASFINVQDGAFRNNIVVRPSLYVFRVLKENGNEGFVDTQNGLITDNIILWNQGDLLEVVNAGLNTQPETFSFQGNQWYNSTMPQNSQLPLPSPETGGTYGVDPQIDFRGISPWDFVWGTWLVNTSDLTDTVTLDPNQTFRLAIPGPGASLDIGADNPLIGSWTFQDVTSSEMTVQPFSYLVLVNSSVP